MAPVYYLFTKFRNEAELPILKNNLAREKILLLNPPGKLLYARDKYCTSISKANYYWPQIDLLVLSGRLKDHYDVTLIDAIATDQTPEVLLQKIETVNYKAVIFLTSSASFDEDFAFVGSLKKRCPALLTIGNGGLLLMRGETIMGTHPELDAILLDFTSTGILDYLSGTPQPKDMITRHNESILRGKQSQEGVFTYPVPLHEQLPIGRYIMPVIAERRLSVSITSIGCRYGCTFCIPSRIPFKRRPAENVIEELQALDRLGFTHVLFHDSTFIADRRYVLELCNLMIQHHVKIRWTCQTRVDTVDEQILSVMHKAGCRAIEYGVESGDDNVLKEMNKGISVDQIRNSFRATHRQNIRTVGFFIIGMPGETRNTMQKTIDLAIEIDCDYASFSLPMPHPGTRLGESVKKNGWVLSERELFDDVSNPSRNIPMVDHDLAWEMRALAYRKFYLRTPYIFKRIRKTRSFYELYIQFREFLSILKRILKTYR